ncbi:hypothetical protein D3C81_1946890 [compost metagenome]
MVIRHPFGGVIFRRGRQRQLVQCRDLPVGTPGQRFAAVFRVIGEGGGVGIWVKIVRPPGGQGRVVVEGFDLGGDLRTEARHQTHLHPALRETGL